MHDELIHFIKKSLHFSEPVLTIEIQWLGFVVIAELNGEQSELGELQIG